MKLIYSERENPQDYYLIDGEGNYTLENEDIADYAPYKALRKKVFDGNADIVLQSDRVQIYWKGSLVAEAQLVAQLSDNDGISWDYSYDFNFLDASIQKITDIDGVPVTQFYRAFEIKDFPAISVTDAVMGMDQRWSFEDTKQVFYLDVPGWLVRIRWQCRVKDSALAYLDDTDPDNPVWIKGLRYSVKDYDGNVNHGSQSDPEPGWTQHWWTFEPDGFQCPDADARTPAERFEDRAGLYVDPYLFIDEQSTYIDVYCDGYLLNIYIENTAWGVLRIYDSSKTTLYWTENWYVESGSNNYYFAYDDSLVLDLVENTPNRVVIRVKANWDRTAGGVDDYLTNSDYVEIHYYIYADRFVVDFKWVCSGTVTVDTEAELPKYDESAANLTNEQNVYENTGSESNASLDTNYNAADYIGVIADEINLQSIVLDESGFDGTINQRSGTVHGEIIYQQDGTDETVGTKIHRLMVILDSAAREGSVQIYNAADRLAMGDQYNDAILDQAPSKGDDITDMILPARISSGTLHSDGGHYYEPGSTNYWGIIFALDILRNRSVFVTRDWPVQTGAENNPTDHLLCHLKCDENAASANLNDETSNNADGTWSNISDGTDRNTNTSGDSVQIFGRGRNLDTQNGAGYIEMTVGSGTVHDNDFLKKGSILINLIPQHVVTVADSEYYWMLWYDANNQIHIRFNYNGDQIYASVEWGGTEILSTSSAYNENDKLQRIHSFLLAWDSDRDIMMFSINGEVEDLLTHTGTPTSNHPTAHNIGCYWDRSYTADIIIDEIKTFDVAILPYGAFYIGNGQGLLADIDNPHSQLSWFWDCQAALAKGGPDLATQKNPTNSGGQFVTTDPILGSNHWDSNGATNVISVAEVGGDIIDYDKGFIAGWFKLQGGATGGEHIFDIYADANNRIRAYFDASENIDAAYESNNTTHTISGNISIGINGPWFWLFVGWDTDNEVFLLVNGKESGFPQSITNSWTGGNGHTWYFSEAYDGTSGSDLFIGAIYMGKDPYMSQLWTAFGKPLHVPKISVT